MNRDEMSHGEIVIVKRGGGGDHDDHHGGVWKIAFADFMTAMMAFFLVMWLINASNEVTKKAVASYFNPIKLMHTNASPKGVQSPKQGMEHINEDVDETLDVNSDSKIAVGAESVDEKYNDQGLFIDPYAVLSEIAGGVEDVEGGENKNESGELSSDSRMGISGGTSFQDPFDPTSWSRQLGLPKDPQKPTTPVDRMSEDSDVEIAVGLSTDENGMMRETEVAEEGQAEIELIEEQAIKEDESAEKSTVDVSEDALEEMREEANQQEISDANEMVSEETEIPDPETNVESEKLAEEISSQIAALTGGNKLTGLELEVLAAGNGAAVVVSDAGQNGMFSIGSARPTKELVLAMEKIGEVIASHAGQIEISGHTDARQYQSADYDNWRLSSARAHMAYYMLTRGGMNESQVERIVGQAAVRLKNPDNPLAAVNRRVEILLKLP